MEKISKEQKKAYIEFLRQHPVEAARELANVELAPHERIILKGFWTHKWNLNVSGRGVGKCAVGSDRIWVEEEKTFRKISEVEGRKFTTYSMSNKKQLEKAEVEVVKDRVKACLKIKTVLGKEVSVSEDNPIFVRNKGWTKAKKVKKGDKIAVACQLFYGNRKVKENVAYSIGKLTSLGQFLFMSGRKTQETRKILNEFYWSREIKHSFGFIRQKKFPELVYSFDKESLENFLRGYFEVKGFLDLKRGKYFALFALNEEISFGLQIVLTMLGIKFSVEERHIHETHGTPIYIIKISDIKSYMKFRRLLKSKSVKTKSRAKITFEKVEFVERLGHLQTYAVSCSINENYLQNLIIVHNTFMNALFGVLRSVLFSREKVVMVAPSFRQSILMFNEAERIVMDSEFLRNTLKNEPKHHTSEYSMNFKNNSRIIALPLGLDGAKIRGTRATLILVDETAFVPADIIDKAIIPFMTTYKDPMAVYLKKEVQKESGNSLVFSSSAHYQFNHLFKKYVYWLEQVKRGNEDYFLSKFTYEDTPEGFIDMDVVNLQRRTSPSMIFAMEYLAVFPRDSVGFFPASLIDSCKDRYVPLLSKGEPQKQYVMGLDPARTIDNFGIVILEIGGGSRKVVRVEAHKGKSLVEMRGKICELLDGFNIVRIAMDKGGGGQALADMLAESYTFISPYTGKVIKSSPIRTIDSSVVGGRNILELITFSPSTISEMNYDLKSKMEEGILKIPDVPNGENIEEAEKIFEEIQKLENELISIDVGETSRGALQFTSSEKHKDRYSALLLANYAASSLEKKQNVIELPIGFWK